MILIIYLLKNMNGTIKDDEVAKQAFNSRHGNFSERFDNKTTEMIIPTRRHVKLSVIKES